MGGLESHNTELVQNNCHGSPGYHQDYHVGVLILLRAEYVAVPLHQIRQAVPMDLSHLTVPTSFWYPSHRVYGPQSIFNIVYEWMACS